MTSDPLVANSKYIVTLIQNKSIQNKANFPEQAVVEINECYLNRIYNSFSVISSLIFKMAISNLNLSPPLLVFLTLSSFLSITLSLLSRRAKEGSSYVPVSSHPISRVICELDLLLYSVPLILPFCFVTPAKAQPQQSENIYLSLLPHT